MSIAALALPFVCLGAVSLAQAGPSPGRIDLLFFDRTGAALTPAQVRSVSNGSHGGYDNDCLIDPANLHALVAAPLKEQDGRLGFALTGQPVALALNWPTIPRGYSVILLDNAGKGFTEPGTINFTYRVALDVRFRLDQALARRRDYRRSDAFTEAYGSAAAHLKVAARAADEATKGKEGQLALDDLAVAYDLLLREHGPAFARANLKRQAPWLGFTLDTADKHEANCDLAAKLAQPYAWVRIVFDPGVAPEHYAPMVAYARSKGIRILGQPVDSSYDKQYSREKYLAQFKRFVDAFPEIDTWELGNEVNGGWLTPELPRKIADVAAYCKSKGKTSVLTLFWQLNTGGLEYSMYSWADAHLPPDVRRNIDVVLISIYPEQAPLGLFFDRMMLGLRAAFPRQRIGVGELGYWIPDQSFWWAYDESDPNGAARREIAAQLYAAALDYPNSVGGCFWWIFADQFPADPAMQRAVSSVRDAVVGGADSR